MITPTKPGRTTRNSSPEGRKRKATPSSQQSKGRKHPKPTSPSKKTIPKRSDRVHFAPSIHIRVLQKEVARERNRRRDLKLPEAAVNLPVTIKQTFSRLSDKNEEIKTGKWLSDLCTRSKRSNNNTTHKVLKVLHTIGVDIGRAMYSKEHNEKLNKDKEERNQRRYDKWFMDNFVKLNMWIGAKGSAAKRSIGDIEDLCDDDDLKKFTKKVTKAYEEGDLKQKYVNMLDAMNFPWRPFNENFQLLCTYYMEKGTMDLDEADDPKLFTFITSMRNMKASGKLNEIEETMLCNVGFPWKVEKRNEGQGQNNKAQMRGETKVARGAGSRVLSVTSPSGKRIALTFPGDRQERNSFGDNHSIGSSSKKRQGFDTLVDQDDVDSSIDNSRIKVLGATGSSLNLSKRSTFSMLSSDDEDDNFMKECPTFGKNPHVADKYNVASAANGTTVLSLSSSEGDNDDEWMEGEIGRNNGKINVNDSMTETEDEEESLEGNGKDGGTLDDSENEEDDKKASEKTSTNKGNNDLVKNGAGEEPFVLTYSSKEGFDSKICTFCCENQTRHHYHVPMSKTGLMFFNDTKICGKSTCHDCKLKEEGYKSTVMCIDCHRAKEGNNNKERSSINKAPNKIKSPKNSDKKKKVYTFDALKKMTVTQLRAVCEEEKIEYGFKRIPGCLKLLKAHFNL